MYPLAMAVVLMWLMSAATPGVPAISKRDTSSTMEFIFMSMESGCPMPPAAPSTATLRPPPSAADAANVRAPETEVLRAAGESFEKAWRSDMRKVD